MAETAPTGGAVITQPVAAVCSPPVRLKAQQLVKISVKVKQARVQTPGGLGLIVRDSILTTGPLCSAPADGNGGNVAARGGSAGGGLVLAGVPPARAEGAPVGARSAPTIPGVAGGAAGILPAVDCATARAM